MQNKILVVEKFYTEYFEVKYTNSKDILLGKKKPLFNFVQKCHRPRILSIIRCSRFLLKNLFFAFLEVPDANSKDILREKKNKKTKKKQNKTQFNFGRKCQ